MTTTLFVCHEGQRTGAPLLLLWLIRWLMANTTIRPVVALMRDGPLREEFSALCPTYTFSTRPVAERWHKRLHRRLLSNHTNDPGAWLAGIVAKVNPDCLYLNTLVLGYCLDKLTIDHNQTRVISHGHEMELGLLLSSTAELVKKQIDFSDLVVCCAESVRTILIDNYQINPELCTVINEYIPYTDPSELLRLQCEDGSQSVINCLRTQRDRGTFLFGFAGSPIGRKGFDVFPQLVKICAEKFGKNPFKAVWVGCGAGSIAYQQAHRDLSLLGVRNHALLLGSVSCGAAALRELDALTLLSREDPYPVVALEAGAMGIPTVCFRHSGGIGELAEQGYGVPVDYLDLEAFASALLQLHQHPEQRRAMGQRFQEKVFSGNTVSTQGPRLAELILGKVSE